jgi:hypothetical protein
MGKDDLAGLMEQNLLHILRRRILDLLDHAYPAQDEIDISECLKREVGIKPILKEMHYLADKGLVTLEPAFEDHTRARLTARGRDFLTGDVMEVGISVLKE